MYCAIRKWKLRCVVLSKTVCELQDAQLFMALSSPNDQQLTPFRVEAILKFIGFWRQWRTLIITRVT
jgi:hypothetical protein